MTALNLRTNYKKPMLALLLVSVVLIGGYRTGKGRGLFRSPEPLPPANTIQELLEQRGHWEHNRALIAALGIAPETSLAPELLPRKGAAGRGVYETMLEDATSFRFSTSGILTNYGKSVGIVEEKRILATTSRGAPVSKKDVVSLAESLLATGAFDERVYEGLKFNVDEKFVTYRAEDNSIPSDGTPDSPTDGTWSIWIERSYKDIGCLSMVRITVDVATGRIEMISNLPFFLPESTEENVSELEAVQVARKYAAKRSIPTDTYESRKEFSYIDDPLTTSWVFAPRSVLCWVVTFQIPEGEHMHPYRVLVDCRTGKVVDVVT